MKECEVHRKLLEEMQNDEPMSDGEVHSDGGDEVHRGILVANISICFCDTSALIIFNLFQPGQYLIPKH